VVALRGRLAWAHDWVSDPSLAAIFQTLPGARFIVNGATPAKNAALASAGAELRLLNGVSLLAKFDGEFANHSQTYTGTANPLHVVERRPRCQTQRPQPMAAEWSNTTGTNCSISMAGSTNLTQSFGDDSTSLPPLFVSLECGDSLRHQRVAFGPVIGVTGEQANALVLAAGEHAKAVVFDLMQPARSGRRVGGGHGLT